MTAVDLLATLGRGRPWSEAVKTIVRNDGTTGALTITAPGDKIWAVLECSITLTTSATVATRIPFLSLTNGNDEIARLWGLTTQAANIISSTSWSSWERTTRSTNLGNIRNAVAIEPILMLPGWALTATASAIAASDLLMPYRVTLIELNVSPTLGAPVTAGPDAEQFATMLEEIALHMEGSR